MSTHQTTSPSKQNDGSSINSKLVLSIPLENLASTRANVFVGDKTRSSTATSVVLLDPQTLVCCHFNGCKMYLIRFNLAAGTYEIVDSLETTYKGIKCETDLMGGDGNGNIIVSNFFEHSCTLYRCDGNKLTFVKDLDYSAGNFVHGAKLWGSNTGCVTTRGQTGGIHFFDIETCKRKFIISTPGLGVQDLCILPDQKIVMIANTGHPSLQAGETYSAMAMILERGKDPQKIRTTARATFEKSHFDNVVFNKGKLFITDQYNNCVLVLDAVNLSTIGSYDNFDFPHGVDANYDVLATTNYGKNTVEIRSLDF